jgi:hypothetical protein
MMNAEFSLSTLIFNAYLPVIYYSKKHVESEF